MGQGLRIWDENGVNLVDTDYRMTQIIGSVYTADLLEGDAYLNGNIYVPEFTTLAGTPFVLNIPANHFIKKRGVSFSAQTWPTVWIEENTVKWIYESIYQNGTYLYTHYDHASWIIWGVY